MDRRERVERSRTDHMATDSGPAQTMTRNVDNGTEQISTKNTDHGKTTTTSRITDNGKTQQGTKNADYGKTTTTSRIMDNGKTQQVTRNADIGRETTTRKIADISKTLAKTQTFEKKLTVAVESIGEENVSMMELLKEIKRICGVVIGCRFKAQKKYEITMENEEGKGKLLDGLKIKDNIVYVREMVNNELVVSFLNLPTYVSDEVILAKLHEWGVKAVSPIKRRMWPGTDIADGTRFLKVQFTEMVKSLPYSTKFDTLEGTEFFRVIHDRQVRVCRLCIQPGHILRDCPQFRCHKCQTQGHYARECPTWNARGGDRADENQEGQRDGEATAVAVVRAGEAAEVSAVAVEADAAAVAAAAEMEPLGSTLDDVVLPEDSPTGRAIGLGVGEGTSGDLMPKMAHESTLVGGGSPRGVGEDSAKDMSSEGEIEGTPEEERDQIRKSWLEEMDIETVSETDEPMDRRAELAKKRKAKKERIVAAKKKGMKK